MNAEQKQRAAELLAAWRATAYALHADRMADLLQELVDAPEAEPVARVTGYYAGYLTIATVDGRVLPAGTALYTAPPARADILVICDALKIGAEARTETVIIESIGNALRRSRCLDAVERDLFTSQIEDEESGELVDDCPLNWGDEPDEYVASVKELLLLRLSAPKPSELLTTTNPAQISSSPAEAPADVARDAERLDWLLRNLPGYALRYCVGVLSDTSDGKEFREAIDAAIERQGDES